MTVTTAATEITPTLRALHRRALEATRAVVAGVDAGQWSDPTPCSAWDVRALVNHLVVGNLWAAELVRGRTIAEVGDVLDGDRLGEDPLRAYDQSAESAASAFEAPGALTAPCAVSYGPVPGEVYAGHRFVDVLVHGWDLAVATGQPSTLDPELVGSCWEIVRPQLAALQASGMFGTEPVTTQPEGVQARLLAALGRVAPGT